MIAMAIAWVKQSLFVSNHVDFAHSCLLLKRQLNEQNSGNILKNQTKGKNGNKLVIEPSSVNRNDTIDKISCMPVTE